MSIAERARQTAQQAAERAKAYAGANKDKIDQAISKAGQAADARTAGKYRDKIAKATDKVSTYVDRLPTPPS